MAAEPDSAGVRFPPPFVDLGALLYLESIHPSCRAVGYPATGAINGLQSNCRKRDPQELRSCQQPALGRCCKGPDTKRVSLGCRRSCVGGERHGKQSVKQWFERMGRVFPKLHIDIEQVEVTGWPWNTTVFVKWRANARLLDGQSSYVNRGVHVFKLRWGKVYSIEEYFDSQAAERSLAIQARAGLDEAAAGPIVS